MQCQLLSPKGDSLTVADTRSSGPIDEGPPPRGTAKSDKILREALISACVVYPQF